MHHKMELHYRFCMYLKVKAVLHTFSSGRQRRLLALGRHIVSAILWGWPASMLDKLSDADMISGEQHSSGGCAVIAQGTLPPRTRRQKHKLPAHDDSVQRRQLLCISKLSHLAGHDTPVVLVLALAVKRRKLASLSAQNCSSCAEKLALYFSLTQGCLPESTQ